MKRTDFATLKILLSADKSCIIIISFSSFIFFILFCYQSLSQYAAIFTQSYDFSIYLQNLWLIINNQTYNTVRDIHIWAHHLEPILYPIAILYKIIEKPEIFFILQAASGAGAAILFYYYLSKLTFSPAFSLFVSILYLLYPAMQNSVLFDFHPGTLALVFFPAFYFHLKKNNKFYALTALILIFSCRENYAITTALTGLYFFHENKTAKIIFFLSLIYFIAAIFIIKPYFNAGAGDTHLKYYSQFGNSAQEIIANLFYNYKLTFSYIFCKNSLFYFLSIYAPVLFIPLLIPKMNLLVLPLFLLNILCNHPGASTIDYHFQNEITPLIFIIIAELYSTNYLKYLKKFSILILTAAFISLYYISSVFIFNDYRTGIMKKDHKKFFLNYSRNIISNEDSLSADVPFAAHFAFRKNIRIFPDINNCDWILLDQKYLSAESKQKLNYIISKIENSGIFKYESCLLINLK